MMMYSITSTPVLMVEIGVKFGVRVFLLENIMEYGLIVQFIEDLVE